MKKIALFIPSMYPSGGAERVTHQLASDFVELGHEVHVVTLSENTFETKSYISHVLRKEEGGFSKILSFFVVPRLLATYCKKNGIDVVISQMERANFMAILAKKISGLRTICVVHSSKNPFKLCNIIFGRLLYGQANHVITVSQGMESKLQDVLRIKNIQTIYNYFDFEKINSKLKGDVLNQDKVFFNNQKNTFINIGRLMSVKGHDLLIKAFSDIDTTNSQLLILGEGPERANLEKLIKRLGLEGSVHLLGNRENIFPYLRESDCFVLSSKQEGFGLVLVEALAANLDVISTDAPHGPREILSEKNILYGRLVQVGDAAALGEAMAGWVLKEKNLEKQKRGVERFSKKSALKKWQEVVGV